MSVLVDTNVLLRRIQPNHEHHTAAIESVTQLLASGEMAYYTLQNVAEFWNVVTRPVTNNRLGLSVSEAQVELEAIERVLTLLPDSPATYAEWKRLVVKHSVLGVRVHDARLAAIMKVHGIERILTFNAEDFTRYGIEIVHPSSIAT
jgi:predicted nucleic acid-binding protein